MEIDGDGGDTGGGDATGSPDAMSMSGGSGADSQPTMTTITTTSTTTAGPSTVTVTVSTTTPTTESTTAVSTVTSEGEVGGFVRRPDAGGPIVPCNVVDQDCPEDLECKPVGDNGEWVDTTCYPVDPQGGQPGDPCAIERDPDSGLDSCGFGSMCWLDDPAALTGTCVPFCIDQDGELTCNDPNAQCVVDGTAIVCLPCCNPLSTDCGAGQCQRIGDAFACNPDVGVGGDLDSCESDVECGPSYACVEGGNLPGCFSEACCTAYCVTNAANPCPEHDDHACVSLFDEPPAQTCVPATLGVCMFQ